ncbi:hypothetical protein [Helicobacter fennelliae]|uniref:Uncharacterized protein n=1 Tax=Helicobacter fennelliae MRY12-0050 TaxID=1325130 RepID=T1CZ51_9HELI|nr:hypothetical protein [Helicobacter fennelliae]GAD18236.1 hypothetical protein HFN_1834 [Helicobacter fennelliae MRY12-0050]
MDCYAKFSILLAMSGRVCHCEVRSNKAKENLKFIFCIATQFYNCSQ